MSYTIVKCPKCGGEMNIRSRQCKHCYAASGSARGHTYDQCPVCGRPKHRSAKTCRACRYKPAKRKSHPRVPQQPFREDLITPEWALQFAGLFMGEGSLSITPSGNGGHIVVCMSLRSDDIAVLLDIQEKLGGTVYQTEGARMSRWNATGLEHCFRILSLITSHTLIPAKKLRDVEIALEYTTWRQSQSCHLGPGASEKTLEFKNRLSDIRTFKVHQG